MKNRVALFLTKLTMICVGLIVVVQAQASMDPLDAGVVYENVGFIGGHERVSESFQITDSGTYQATLIDFEFPEAFELLSLSVVTATEEMGRVSTEGYFIFEADPGTYYANLFGWSGGGLDLGLYGVQVALIDGFDSVSPVPLPAPIVLLASALVAFVGFGRGATRVVNGDDDAMQMTA